MAVDGNTGLASTKRTRSTDCMKEPGHPAILVLAVGESRYMRSEADQIESPAVDNAEAVHSTQIDPGI